jgi:MFS family permease
MSGTAGATRRSSDDAETKTPTPLPVKQFVALSILQFSINFQGTVMWPMVPFMVADFVAGATEKVIGYYIGILTSSFFFAQVASSLPWGWVSDKWGRRPVLLFCTAGSIFSFFGFGFAPTFWFAVFCRTISGSFDATNGIIKAYVGEITDSTNQARGFAILSLVYGSSAVIAPMFGGLLLNFWEDHPYAAPVVLGTVVGVVGLVASYFYLPESPAFIKKKEAENVTKSTFKMSAVAKQTEFAQLPANEHEAEAGSPKSEGGFQSTSFDEDDDLIDPAFPTSPATSDSAVKQERSLNLMTALKNKEVLLSTSLYGLLAFAFVIYDELLPVFGRAAISDGGLGFSSKQVGYLLALQGVTMVLFQFLVFPRLAARFGAVQLFRYGSVVFLPVLCFIPVTASLAASGQKVLLWVFLAAFMIGRSCCSCTLYTCVMLLINNSTSSANFGVVNGVGQTFAALARSFGPLTGGVLWSLGHSLGFSYLAYFVMAGACSSVFALSLKLPDHLVRPQGQQHIEHMVE